MAHHRHSVHAKGKHQVHMHAHMHGKKRGGGVSEHSGAHKGEVVYAGKGSNVEHEAEEKKHGGKVHGHKSKHRLDKRARGGRTGSNMHPFSSAKTHEMGNLTKN